MASILAYHLPPPGTASPTRPPLLLQLNEQTGLIVNSHPTTLHLFINNTLQNAWSFPHPIVSYSCSYFSNDSKKKQRQDTENNGIVVLLVATHDGSIWNVPLSSSYSSSSSSLPVTNNNNNSSSNPGVASSSTRQTTTTNKSTLSRKKDSTPSPEIAIKIEDDDKINIKKEEEEEVELWNDEDGLVVDQAFDEIDSLLPPSSKRQRIDSPPPATAVTTSFSGATATGSDHQVRVVSSEQHLVGSEANISHIAFIAGELLIFRHGERLVHWSSLYQFAPHTDIIRQLVPNNAVDKLQAVTCISEHLPGRNEDRQEEGLLVATVSSAIYRISILDSKLDMQELFKVKEPVAALLSVPIQSSSQSDSLVVVVGAKGTMSWSKNTQPDQERGRPVATKPKTLSFDVDVQTGFIAEDNLYVLTEPGRVLRLPLESLGSMDDKDLEIVDLPPLCALSPILSHDSTTVKGLYGLNQRGQLLRFPADWSRHARPQSVADARDTVGRALSELEKLSDQVKQLEIQCQLENQRIATYNRLVFELQQSVLANSRQDIGSGNRGEDVEMHVDVESGLLIETFVSTFSHIVSDGFEGTRRFYARLRIKSRANIDWSRGWSVGVNVAKKVEFCLHGKPTSPRTNTRTHHQTYASLRTLTCQTPWTLDIELDREMMHSLPLQVSIGLLFHESSNTGRASGNLKAYDREEGFAAYFVVDSVDLDVLDFVEGVDDLLNRNVPAFTQHQTRSRPTTIANNTDNMEDGVQGKCMQCVVEKGNSSGTGTGTGTGTEMDKKDAASLFRPLEFEIDTTSIPISQCLPALLFSEDCDHYGSSGSNGRAVKVVDMAEVGRSKGKGMGLGVGVGMEVGMKVQACFRTCFVLPDECLNSSDLTVIRPVICTSTSHLQGQGHRNVVRIGSDAMRSFASKTWGGRAEVAGGQGQGGQMEDTDFGMVWVDLIEGVAPAGGGGHKAQQQHGRGQEKLMGGLVKAHILVRGSDPERVLVVRQAFERRIRALFD